MTTAEMDAMHREEVAWTRALFEPWSSHDWGVFARLADVLAEDEEALT